MIKFRTIGPFNVNLVLLTLAATGCGGSPQEPDETRESTYSEALYALMSQVYTNDDRTVFLKTFSSLDTDELTLKDAREFPGVANFRFCGRAPPRI